MSEAGTGHEELLRLLLEYRARQGEGESWLLLALSLVTLDRMVGLVGQRAAWGLPPAKDANPTKGLVDLLGALGPLMGSFKPARPHPGAAQSVPPAGEPPQQSAASGAEEAPPRPARNEVIKWDPRLVGGGRR